MFIVDEDENNLSVWAMLNTPYLLVGVLLKNDRFEVNIIQEDSSKGCILEVDFGYRLELHNLHNNYPLDFEKKLSQRQYAV